VQSLPGMYVQTFRRWIVEDAEDANSCSSTLKIEPIKGTGLSDLPHDEGWVNPTSTNELWWPLDIKTLQVRPTLNVVFKSAIVSYVSIGLDVRVPHKGGTWRNFGMHSQPIARQMTTLHIAMEKLFHAEGFVLHTQQSIDAGEMKHEPLFESIDADATMQKLATFIGELDAFSPLAEGFHIVSFPMTNEWTDLPAPTERAASDADGTVYKIVCMATSEPFASKLLDLDEDLLTMSSTSVMELIVLRTDAGGASEFLPEPYKPLYS